MYGIVPDRVELLAPAGSREAFEGALAAGADAVYLGGERFGARAYADNFSTEEILRAIRDAHILGRKVYLTANVLTRESEMEDLVRFVQELYAGGLDGAIVQDIGVLAALGRVCPGLPLHASTQLSVTSAESVRYLRRFGVRRVVPARELSLEEIRLLRTELSGLPGRPVEIEAFIHGAMCYAYSGRCLMSSFLGGRSGNRGRCAGPCRLPYRVLDPDGRPAGPDARKKEYYPLSMKDLCVLSILPGLIDAGISSFKIEGRMKQPVYAAGVTAVYRKYIDRCYAWMEAGRPTPWTVEEADLQQLRALYLRTSLGTGYYHVRNGRSLVTIGKPGYAGTDAALEKEIRLQYLSGLPKRQIEGKAVLRIGRPALLTVRTAGVSAQERFDMVGRVKNIADAIFFTPEVCVEAPQTSAGSHRRNRLRDFASGVSAQERFDMSVREDHNASSLTVTGQVVQAAGTRPLEPEEIAARLKKTGDSPFVFRSLEIEADDHIFLPVSAVNALRRDALLQLGETLTRSGQQAESEKVKETDAGGSMPAAAGLRDTILSVSGTDETMSRAFGTGETFPAVSGTEETMFSGSGSGELWALVSTPAQMRAAGEAGCTCVIIDGTFRPQIRRDQSAGEDPVDPVDQKTREWKSIQYFCALPPVFRVSYRETLRKQIRTAPKRGFSGLLVRTPEELILVKEEGYRGRIIADASLYAWNGRAMAELFRDCDRIVAPLELEEKGIRRAAAAARKAGAGCDLTARLILPVYGRVPMMESAGCIRKTEGRCSREAGDLKTGRKHSRKAGILRADADYSHETGDRQSTVKNSHEAEDRMTADGRFWYLEDRTGRRLPVRCRCEYCSNTIYNAVPISLHPFAGKGLYREVPVRLCMFTTETAGQTRRILEFFAALDREPAGDGAQSKTAAAGGTIPGSNVKADGSGPVSPSKTGRNRAGEIPAGKKKRSGRGESPVEDRLPFPEYTSAHFRSGVL